ncbi:MAG: SRPBCC family protein [Polyangiaceae bacterium]|nr:SRPBCC family protein [Polyangiaceae bacterium]
MANRIYHPIRHASPAAKQQDMHFCTLKNQMGRDKRPNVPHSRPMHFELRSEFRCTPEELFAFHERPEALALLAPPGGPVEIIQPPASLRVGEEALLRVGLGPFKIQWVARHTVYEPPHRFVDEQMSGPFRRWRHEHRVEPCGIGAALIDSIDFELPGGPLGKVMAPLVAGGLKKSFKTRHDVTRREVERSNP